MKKRNPVADLRRICHLLRKRSGIRTPRVRIIYELRKTGDVSYLFTAKYNSDRNEVIGFKHLSWHLKTDWVAGLSRLAERYGSDQ